VVKRIAHIVLDWGNRYGQASKSIKELENDGQLVKAILDRMGQSALFTPGRQSYPFFLEAESTSFDILITELQANPHLVIPSPRVTKSYNQRELEAADLLWWWPPNQTSERDRYEEYAKWGSIPEQERTGDLYKRCPGCNAPIEQERQLIINKSLMRDKDFSATYTAEIVLSESVARLLQEEEVTGFELWPVRHYKQPYQGEPVLYQLMTTAKLPPMASPPTEFENTLDCVVCRRKSQYLKLVHQWNRIQYYEESAIYYQHSVLESGICDFNYTAEWFGDRGLIRPFSIITQRTYRLLRDCKVKNWTAIPVFLLD
jgi:hypothetical protein